MRTHATLLIVLCTLLAGAAPAAAVGANPGATAAVDANPALQQDVPDCTYPYSSTDATGTEVTIEETPETVTTLGPSAAQTMWEIGGKEQVIGLSSNAHYLDDAESRTDVSASGFGYSTEAVVGTEADLVLAANIAPTDTVTALREAGMTVYKMPAATSVEDVESKTKLIGRLTGNCEGAAEANSWMTANVEAAGDATSSVDRPDVLVPLGGGSLAGGGTFINAMVTTAGATNLAVDAFNTPYPYQVSDEKIIELDPEMLVLQEGSEDLIESEPYSLTTAGQNDASVTINPNYLSQPAPRSVVYATRNLTEGFHPDAAASAEWTARSEVSIPEKYDREIEAGETVFQGQKILVDVSGVSGTGLELRQVDYSDGTAYVSGSPTALSAENDRVVIDTEGLDATQWVITTQSRGAEVADDDVLFEIVEQDLSATFDEDEVGNEGEDALVDYEIESDARNGYPVNVSAEGLDEQDLADIFGDEFDNDVTEDLGEEYTRSDIMSYDAGNGDYAIHEEEELITLFGAEGTHELNFSDISTGEYELEANVVDTTGSASDSIEVTETAEGEVSFSESSYTEQRGDIANLTVEMSGASDVASVTIGELDDDGYQYNVTVEDDNDDGQVSLLFNSYAAGNDNPENDIVTVANEDDNIVDSSGVEHEDVSFDGLLSEGSYDIYAQTGNHDGDYQSVINNGEGVSSLYLEERSTDSLAVWAAPQGDFEDFEEVADIEDAMDDGTITETSSMAKGDVVVHELGVSGISGFLGVEGDGEVTEDFLDAITENSGVNLTVEQTNPGQNQQEAILDLANSEDAVTVLANADENSYYVILDTSDAQFDRGETENAAIDSDELELRDDAEFETELSITDEALLGVDDEVRGVEAGDEDDWESVNSTFTLADRDASFDQDPIQVAAGADQKITGTTTVAPGTEITVRVSATDDTEPRFRYTQDVNVSADQTFSATFDFSDQSTGDTFEASLSGQAAPSIDGVDGEVVESPSTATITPSEGTETAEPSGETATATAEPTTDGPSGETATATAEPSTTSTSTPGFGVSVALVALIGVTLLSGRRD